MKGALISLDIFISPNQFQIVSADYTIPNAMTTFLGSLRIHFRRNDLINNYPHWKKKSLLY
jgi:hypothetical protein